jgi:hypothetical protein
MIITTADMIAKGATKQQTDILDTVSAGSLDTSNVATATALSKAGFNLVWVCKKFQTDPTIPQAIVDARNAARTILVDGKAEAIRLANASVVELPPVGGPVTAYNTAKAVILGPDAEKILTDAVKVLDDSVSTVVATADATAFVAVMSAV